MPELPGYAGFTHVPAPHETAWQRFKTRISAPLTDLHDFERQGLLTGGTLAGVVASFPVALAGKQIHLMNEAVKEGVRAAPPPGTIEHYIALNGGDLNEGVSFAFFSMFAMVGVVPLLLDKLPETSNPIINGGRAFCEFLTKDLKRFPALATMVSMTGIALAETAGIGNVPDFADMPAGFLGGAFYGLASFGFMKLFQGLFIPFGDES